MAAGRSSSLPGARSREDAAATPALVAVSSTRPAPAAARNRPRTGGMGMMRRFLYLGSIALTAALVSVIGCSTNSGGETDDDEDTGMAQIAISQVPLDGSVGCISVTAEGSFTVTESVDVTPGQSTLIDMK